MTIGNDAASSAVTSNIFDVKNLAALQRQVKAGDPAGNKAVARQFESFFLQMVLKAMRDATPAEGLFNSDQTRMYESLLDQQLAQVIGGGKRGTGLAAMIEAQLARRNEDPLPFDGPLPLQRAAPVYRLPQERSLPLPRDAGPESMPLPASSVGQAPAVAPAPGSASSATTAVQRAFIERLLPAAAAAEQSTGIPAHFMVAQAALETGWGKSEPTHADGSSSFNIFGIKAGPNWRGPAVHSNTTEVIAGLAQVRVERFRAYGSYDEAFRDYANLLVSNPRYAAVVGVQEPAGFARGLQAAGYATDPLYAAKLERIIGGATLRQAMTG